MPVDTRSSSASKASTSLNTFPKSTNAEMRAAGLSNSVGKNISSEPTVFSEPPSGCSRSEEHTSELQSLMRNSYAVFCLKKKHNTQRKTNNNQQTTHKPNTITYK